MTDDGDIVFTGSIDNDYEIDGQFRIISDAWLLKVDSMGCFEPGCNEDYVLVGIREAIDGTKTYYQKYMDIYPNPIASSDDLTVTFTYGVQHKDAHIILRDSYGRQRSISTLGSGDGDLSIDISGFAAGIYFISYYRRGKVLQTEKVVVL